MNANQLTFGVEFETTMPAAFAGRVGSYSSAAPVDFLPEGWKCKTDSSIQAGPGRCGVEFISPILKGEAGLKSVLAAVAALKANGAEVNASTGFHVHVGGFVIEAKELEKIVSLVANSEKAIFASTGTPAREQGRWCKGLQSSGSYHNHCHGGEHYSPSMDRYHVLNLTNLTNSKKTVEFRAFAGTLNSLKVTGYIRMCLGLVEKATEAKRKTTWIAKPTAENSPVKRSGEGQTELTRLFYQLGWTKGRSSVVFGNVNCENAPTIEATKRELMKMARKYDATKAGR